MEVVASAWRLAENPEMTICETFTTAKFFLLFNAHIILCWSTVYIHFYAVILVASAKSRPWRPSGAPVCNSSNKMQLLNHPNPLPSAPEKGRKKKREVSLSVQSVSRNRNVATWTSCFFFAILLLVPVGVGRWAPVAPWAWDRVWCDSNCNIPICSRWS